jgi:hypothetical protein
MTEKSKKGRSLRPVLSVRNLMLLVLLIGGGLGWLLQKPMAQARAIRAIRDQGGSAVKSRGCFFWLEDDRNRLTVWLEAMKRRIGYEFFMTVREVTLRSNVHEALLEKIACLDEISELSFYDCNQISANEMKIVGQIATLEEIAFMGGKIESGSLAGLVKLPKLDRLVIDGLDLSDEDLAPLAQMSGLKALYIRDCPRLTDESLRCLRSLNNLQELTIENCGFTSQALTHVGKIVSLESLWITKTKVTDLSDLGSLSQLDMIDLSENQIGDDNLAKLADLPKLTRVNLSENPLRRPGMITGKVAKNRWSLSLDSTALDDEGVAQLANLSGLKWLSLENTVVTSDCLNQLAKLPKLQGLSLIGTSVSDQGLEMLAGMPELKSLYLGRTKVTFAGVASLQDRRPSLTILHDTKTPAETVEESNSTIKQ